MGKLRPTLLLAVVATIGSCSSPSRRPNPAYYLGETYLRRGQLDQAVDAYKVFIADPGANPDLYLPRAYYMLAFAYYRQGRLEDAMSTLDDLERRYPDMDSVQVWTLRGDVSRDLGYKVQAVQEYDEAARFAGPMDRIRLETRFSNLLKEMNVEELTQAESLVSDPTLHDLTAQQLVAAGGSLIAAEDEAAAADEAAALAAAPVGQPVARAQERRAGREDGEPAGERSKEGLGVVEESPPLAVERPPAGPGKIVCLAPLTGPDSAVGEKVCASVAAAFGEHADRVVSQDAGETANAARAAWMTAVEDPAVVGAVAWLPRESLQAVMPLVESAGVPMVVVSGAAGDGRYVRGWGLGRSQEVNGLVNYMVGVVHIERFGVLYPETEAGNDYLDRFSAAVNGAGAKVVGRQFYRAAATSSALETIRKWRQRDINAEAVFIPDQLANAEELVAMINDRYPDLIVLGLSSWSPTTMPVRAFVASGTDTAAYDAASAFYGAVVGGGASTRSDVDARLRNVDAESVASNATPTILRLQGGTAEAVGG
jgi:ABC-type branched-subunit amino acid transport system substrate-binding protein